MIKLKDILTELRGGKTLWVFDADDTLVESDHWIFITHADGSKSKLDPAEFEQALASFGIFPKKVELQSLMKFYDIDGDGSISYNEFLSGLREELTERRANMVKKAFSVLDTNGSGSITVGDIQHIYDVSMNPEFLEGKKSKD